MASLKTWAVFSAAACVFALLFMSPAPAQQRLPCQSASIMSITLPKGPARYEAGKIQLSNLASLELSGALNSPAISRVQQMRVNDPVAACYGPLRRYADAGPSRTTTILDLRTGGYYGTLIGNWPNGALHPTDP